MLVAIVLFVSIVALFFWIRSWRRSRLTLADRILDASKRLPQAGTIRADWETLRELGERGRRELPPRLVTILPQSESRFLDAVDIAVRLYVDQKDTIGLCEEVAASSARDSLRKAYQVVTDIKTLFEQIEQLRSGGFTKALDEAETIVLSINQELGNAQQAGYDTRFPVKVVRHTTQPYRSSAFTALDPALGDAYALIEDAKDVDLQHQDPLLAREQVREGVKQAQGIKATLETRIRLKDAHTTARASIDAAFRRRQAAVDDLERDLASLRTQQAEPAFANCDRRVLQIYACLMRAKEELVNAERAANTRDFAVADLAIAAAKEQLVATQEDMQYVHEKLEAVKKAIETHIGKRTDAEKRIATSQERAEVTCEVARVHPILKRARQELVEGNMALAQSPPDYLRAVLLYACAYQSAWEANSMTYTGTLSSGSGSAAPARRLRVVTPAAPATVAESRTPHTRDHRSKIRVAPEVTSPTPEDSSRSLFDEERRGPDLLETLFGGNTDNDKGSGDNS